MMAKKSVKCGQTHNWIVWDEGFNAEHEARETGIPAKNPYDKKKTKRLYNSWKAGQEAYSPVLWAKRKENQRRFARPK